MRKNIIPKIIVLFILISLILLVFRFRDRIFLRIEKVDLNKYYSLKEDEVALYYNDELQSARAIRKDNKVYLPLNFVSVVINDKFYYSDEEKLIYTLNDEILYSDYDTKSKDGHNILLKVKDDVYILTDIVLSYTELEHKIFLEDEINRIFINNQFDFQEAYAKRHYKLREKRDKKSKYLSVIKRNSSLKILEKNIEDIIDDATIKFIKVLSEDGYIGYVDKKILKNISYKSLKRGFKKEEYKNLSLNKNVILAWHQVTTKGANQGIKNIVNNKVVNVISPTWFSLSDNLGNFTSLADKEYVEKAHKSGKQVWALIDNFSKDVSTLKITSNTKARQNLIKNLIVETKKNNIDGINLDFEGLSKEAIKHYIHFIRELSIETRKNNIILSVDVPNYQDYNMHYKRDKIGEVVDYIINMGYDEHYAGSSKGSVASLEYVREGIDASLKEVDKNKLINAIPTYTRIWTDKSSKAIGIKASKIWIKENDVSLDWDESLGQYYGSVNIDGEEKYIWLEDENSLKLKLDYAKEKGLIGTAIWKIGLEDDDFWTLLKEYK